MRILLLAGTTEARRIAAALAEDSRISAIASLAGATPQPADLGIPTRTGGFGGPDGLARYVESEGIDLLVDATHPFAATMKASAAAQTIPALHVTRPVWKPERGDRWLDCTDMADAARRLPGDARAFLALGHRHLEAFADHPAHRVVRSLQTNDNAPGFEWIVAPPGDEASERDLLHRHRITHLVCRNAGGAAGQVKLQAARQLGLPVLMIRRPAPPRGHIVETPREALAWIDRQALHWAGTREEPS